MDRRYDLRALLQALQAAGAHGPVTKQQAAEFCQLIADWVRTDDAATAFDVLYARWRTKAPADPERILFAAHLLQLVPLMRTVRPCCTPQQEHELQGAGQAMGVQELPTGTSAVRGVPDELNSAAARAVHAQQHGGEQELEDAINDLERLRDSLPLNGDQKTYLTAFATTLRAERTYRQRAEKSLEEYVNELEALLATLPQDFPERSGVQDWLANDRGKLQLLTSRRTGRLPATAMAGRPAEPPPPGSGPNTLIDAGMSRITAAVFTQNTEEVVEGLHLLEDALLSLDPEDDLWVRCAVALGSGHFLLSVLVRWAQPRILIGGSRAGREVIGQLDRGITLLRHARLAAVGPQHQQWSAIGTGLASGYRLRSRMPDLRAAASEQLRAQARETGLAALPGFTWNVLLQSGTDHATEVGTRVSDEALDIARWCVADGVLDAAVRAVDTGRGLVLHAAQVAATVPDLLSALGHPDLAGEWNEAGPMPLDAVGGPLSNSTPDVSAAFTNGAPSGPSVRLRRRVLDVLSASPHRQWLLEPPSTAETATALRAMNADALVYLVPAGELLERPGERTPGAALVVLADGTTRHVGLPDLSLDAPALTAYRATGSPGRNIGVPPSGHGAAPVTTTPAQDREALDQLCGWAWKAALRDVLKGLRGALPGGRVPSLVLIPMGALGVVPWHAAWYEERQGPLGGRNRRYALTDAQISYMPSARMLCEVAARGPHTSGGQALIVGNPTGDIWHAGKEAEAIHDMFYPDGVLLDDRTGTAAEVSARLRGMRGGVVHLACHGVMDPGKRHSAYLRLARDTRLSAEELTEGARSRPGPDAVWLAACSTNVSGRGYDEAYSLATAFLVAGARTVFGSLWPVPDGTTSLLMYMAHHYMRRESLPPAKALHRAQRWMVNDRREVPADMPAQLANRVQSIMPEDLAGWAGFTHLGW